MAAALVAPDGGAPPRDGPGIRPVACVSADAAPVEPNIAEPGPGREAVERAGRALEQTARVDPLAQAGNVPLPERPALRQKLAALLRPNALARQWVRAPATVVWRWLAARRRRTHGYGLELAV